MGAAALASLLLLGAALATDPRAQLDALKARQAAEQAAAAALRDREGSLLSAIDRGERAWMEADGAARVAEAERLSAAGGLERARADEEAAQGRLEALQEELGPRLRALAREGGGAELRLLAGSCSLADLVKRRFLWGRLVEHDLALLREGQRALAARESARRFQEIEAARVEELATAARSRREAASARRAEHQALLATVRGQRSLHERAAAEAAAQEARLADFVASLPPAGAGVSARSGFAALRGRLPLPAAGTVEVGFGRVVNMRFNTVTVQKGLDIRAPAGAEVRAVAPGRVAHAGWFKGYGNLIIVDHGGGYHTLVAHLASMSTAIGEEVQAGTPIGTVGDTGSLKGTYLYFEIRERGRPVDPAAWLRP